MWRLYSDITDEYSSGVGNPMGFADIARYWALKQDELAPWNGPGVSILVSLLTSVAVDFCATCLPTLVRLVVFVWVDSSLSSPNADMVRTFAVAALE